MFTTDIPKKFPFSEEELLKGMDEYNAHADEIALLTESELTESSYD